MQRIRQYLARPGLGPMLIKAVVGSAGLRIVGMGFGFLVGVQLARGLGVEGYGIYGLAMSIIALLTVPTEFGLPQLLTREVAAAQANNEWGKVHGVIRWATRANLIISILAAFLVLAWLILSGKAINSPLGITLLAGLVMMPLIGQGNLRGAALRGLQHIVKGQIPEILLRPAVFSLLLFTVPLLLVPLSPELAMGLGSISALFSLLFVTLMLRNKMPYALLHVEPIINSKKWISSALPMALTQSMHVLQGNAALILLGLLSTTFMVGSFRVASSLIVLVGFPISLFNIVSGPIISRMQEQKNPKAMQYLLAYLALGMFVGTLIVTLPIFFFGPELLSFVFGKEFLSSVLPLKIICIGMISCSFLGANAILLNMCGYEKKVTRAFAIALTFLICAGIPLIYFYASTGAAIANASSILLWNLILHREAKRLLNLDTSLIVAFKEPEIFFQHH